MLTENQLTEITELAALLFSVQEVATIMQLDPSRCRRWARLPTSAFYRAYQRGKLQTEADLRQVAIALAKGGSAPAYESVLRMVAQTNTKNP